MILNIESATHICSVALSEGNSILAFREISGGYSHAEKLTVFISELLDERKVRLGDLQAVAVSSGPGSYTGLRIGVSVAKGLCFAEELPLIGIPTLSSMTAGAIEITRNENDALFCPMIDARRMEVYCALYERDLNCVKQAEAKVVTPDLYSEISAIRKIYFFGDGAFKCTEILPSNYIYLADSFPSATHMAALADKKLKAAEFENLALFEPFYLKEYKATVKKTE